MPVYDTYIYIQIINRESYSQDRELRNWDSNIRCNKSDLLQTLEFLHSFQDPGLSNYIRFDINIDIDIMVSFQKR